MPHTIFEIKGVPGMRRPWPGKTSVITYRMWPPILGMRVLILAVLLAATPAKAQSLLPGSKPLVLDGDPATQMVEAVHAYLDRETALARERREKRSAGPDRETFRRLIGAV